MGPPETRLGRSSFRATPAIGSSTLRVTPAYQTTTSGPRPMDLLRQEAASCKTRTSPFRLSYCPCWRVAAGSSATHRGRMERPSMSCRTNAATTESSSSQAAPKEVICCKRSEGSTSVGTATRWATSPPIRRVTSAIGYVSEHPTIEGASRSCVGYRRARLRGDDVHACVLSGHCDFALLGVRDHSPAGGL
jgi:hypothetical protein